MASSSKKRTTMAKLNREQALRERRELKQSRKDAKRNAARTEAPREEPEAQRTDAA